MFFRVKHLKHQTRFGDFAFFGKECRLFAGIRIYLRRID